MYIILLWTVHSFYTGYVTLCIEEYKNLLDDNKIISSMIKEGCYYDNSCVESFFAALKKECIYRKSYATIEEIRHGAFEYIELFYNKKHIHSVLVYMSTVEYILINCS